MPDEEPFKWPGDWEKAVPAIERRVRAICASFRVSPADAEEVDAEVKSAFWMQTVRFARVGQPVIPDIPHAAAWSAKTAIRILIALKERQGRMRDFGDIDVASARAAEAIDSEFDADLASIKNSRAREVVRLKIVENFTLDEIGERLKLSKTRVYQLFHQGGRELLRRARTGDDYDH